MINGGYVNKRFLLIILVCAAVFFGLLFVNKKDAEAPSGETAPTSHILGSEDAPVTLVEYGDFQCPACGAYYPILKEAKAKYGDRLAFQFRHFPLVQIHPNAMAAHRAAEAAGEQGKFFEMHDLLYERQSLWTGSQNPAPVFEGYADELGLDLEQYRQDVASSETNSVIQADLAAGQELSVTATPTFVLNGTRIEENPRDTEGFSKLIDEAFESANSQE